MRVNEFVLTKIKEAVDLFEINMSPNNLERLANQLTRVRVGMEFEMCVPGTGESDSDDFLPEPYNMDEIAYSFSDIEGFFRGENSARSVDRLISKLRDSYNEWVNDKIDTAWQKDKREIVADYLVNNEIDGADNMADDELAELVDKVLDGGEYRKLLENIIEYFFETERNDDTYSESEFLSDNSYDTMWDVYNEYDHIIDWPYYTEQDYSEPESQISGKEIAEDFSDSVGVTAIYSDSRYKNVSTTNWRVEPDGSISTDDTTDAGLEFVTPNGGLPLDVMLEKMELVKKWTNRMGCYTNSTTGLHISVSISNFNKDTIDYVKLVLLLGDNYILDVFNRRGNNYARSSFDDINRRITSDPSIATRMFEKMRGELDQFASQLIASENPARTFSVNLKDNYIEFRSPGGDYLSEPFWSQIKPTMLRFIVALDAASDPKKYREEYLKKLYQLLGASNKKPGDITKLFAKYVAGEMPRSALVSFVRQAQTQRSISRGIASGQKYWWKVELPGSGYSIEVVGKDAEEAKQRALDSTSEWVSQGVTAGRLRATPVRPYDSNTQRNELEQPSQQTQRYNVFSVTDPNNIIGFFMATPDNTREAFQQYLRSRGRNSPAGYGFERATS